MISLGTKIKAMQAVVYAGVLYTLFFNFTLSYFLLSFFVLGWFAALMGVVCGLHRYASHKTFEPKNRVIKIILLWFAAMMTFGSTIAWSATHRKHHQYADQDEDPHSPNTHGGGFWRSVRLWFYYYPNYHVNPRIVKDLTSDPDHAWFHRNYFKVIFSYIGLLYLLGGITAVGYFYFIPVLYGFFGISYITVLAHNKYLSKLGYRNFNTNDFTFNSKLASVLAPCEGNHNNHHAVPAAASNALAKGDWDTGFWMIKLIGRYPDQSRFQKLD